ncbi:hypothetical protein D9M68_524040 [compost metagenome]
MTGHGQLDLFAVDLLATAADQILQAAAEHVIGLAVDDLGVHEVARAVVTIAGEGFPVALFRAEVAMDGVRPLEGGLADLARLGILLSARHQDADVVPGRYRPAVGGVVCFGRVILVAEHDHALGDAEDIVGTHTEELLQLGGTVGHQHATGVGEIDPAVVDGGFEPGDDRAAEHQPGRLGRSDQRNQGLGLQVGRHRHGAAGHQEGPEAAAHVEVVDHRLRHEQDVVRPVVQPARHRPHVVQVLVVKARDDLRHPGGTAGQLEYGNLEGVQHHTLDKRLGLFQIDPGNELVLVQDALLRLTPHLHDQLQRRCGFLHLAGEADAVELRIVALDDMQLGLSQLRQVTDFALAVCGQGADRDQPGLEAGEESDDQLLAIAQLEHHAIQRLQALFQEGGSQAGGEPVQFAVSNAQIRPQQGDVVGELPNDRTEAVRHGFEAKHSVRKVTVEFTLLRVDDAGYRHCDVPQRLRVKAGNGRGSGGFYFCNCHDCTLLLVGLEVVLKPTSQVFAGDALARDFALVQGLPVVVAPYAVVLFAGRGDRVEDGVGIRREHAVVAGVFDEQRGLLD